MPIVPEIILLPAVIFTAVNLTITAFSQNQALVDSEKIGKLSKFIQMKTASLITSIAVFVASGNFKAGACTFLITGLLSKYASVRIIRRKTESLVKQLPFVAVTVSLLIESGSSVQYALEKLIDSIPESEARNYLLRLRNVMQVGENAEGLLKSLYQAYPDDTVRTVSEILINSNELGIGPGEALKEIADKLLEQRMAKAEERALKAPVKLMLPLCGFIFPAIFILIFTPVMFQIGGALK